LKKVLFQFKKFSVQNRLPHFFYEMNNKVQVVNGGKGVRQNFVGSKKVREVSAGIAPAGVAGAVLLNSAKILFEAGIQNVDVSAAAIERTVARQSGRRDAVK
jgi:hypothetical protein